jgi:hypothetical protein
MFQKVLSGYIAAVLTLMLLINGYFVWYVYRFVESGELDKSFRNGAYMAQTEVQEELRARLSR